MSCTCLHFKRAHSIEYICTKMTSAATSVISVYLLLSCLLYERILKMVTKRRGSVSIHGNSKITASLKNENFDNAFVNSTKAALLTVFVIFVASLSVLVWTYMSFPKLEESERSHIKLPLKLEDAKNLGKVLSKYKDKYFNQVLALIFVTYLFLQTFAIPGSISLSVLSGFLYPFPFALVLVCFCSATGASLCYLLSSVLGRKLVHKYWHEKAAKWSALVQKHRDNILNYMLFLRMTPFLPNWFINIAAPCIDVPLVPFWVGTFFGVGPPSFLAIQAGQTLHQLSAEESTWSWKSMCLLGLFASLSLLPVLLKNRLRKKFE